MKYTYENIKTEMIKDIAKSAMNNNECKHEGVVTSKTTTC